MLGDDRHFCSSSVLLSEEDFAFVQLAENFEIPSELFVEGFVNQAVLIVGDAEALVGGDRS